MRKTKMICCIGLCVLLMTPCRAISGEQMAETKRLIVELFERQNTNRDWYNLQAEKQQAFAALTRAKAPYSAYRETARYYLLREKAIKNDKKE